MRDSAIRHLAACGDSPLIAAAVFDSTVQIWSLNNAQQIGEFETTLNFGGKRLVLAADGDVCITGSWAAGFAAYSVPTGTVLWHRSDLAEIQRLTVDASGRNVYCGFENRPLAIVDVLTGAVTGTIKGALRVVSRRSGSDRLVIERSRYRVEGDHNLQICPTSFAVLDAVLSPEAVCISEPRTGIRCIELRSGVTLWHHPGLESNYLAFATSDYEFYCVALSDAPPHNASLIRLAPNLLDCDLVVPLGTCWEATFAQSGNVLVTMRGSVYETSSGRLLTELRFPQRDYLDL
jgi:hypothetical protein